MQKYIHSKIHTRSTTSYPESIHIWIIDTLEGQLSFHDIDPRIYPSGWDLSSKSRIPVKSVVFFFYFSIMKTTVIGQPCDNDLQVMN